MGRPLDLLFEAMERGQSLGEQARARLSRAADAVAASPVGSTSAGRKLASVLRPAEPKRLAVVPQPKTIRDLFAPDPARPATEKLVDAAIPIQIFGRRTCQWSGRALRLAQDRELTHSFVDLGEGGREVLEPKLAALTKQTTSPWVFVLGEHVGGFAALDQLDRTGHLELMLLPPAEREARARKLGLRLERPPPPREP